MERDDKIREVIKIFVRASGRSNILPANTDPKDTYQWRYAARFVDRMDQTQVSWDVMEQIIYLIVDHVKEHKSLWSKGLWILTRKDIIDISYNKINKSLLSKHSILDVLKRNYEFAEEHNFEFSAKPNKFGYPNLISWYNANYINHNYIALSESCNRAMCELDNSDRRRLPIKNITMQRILLTSDNEFKRKAKEIMPKDFINL
ncbi:MAG: hypothetical protein GF411_13965 [Candidatus Lokiarchaeota archaeon]|nr:hypothetical protein [Candidatus Lokiarchaeota archaeon]